MDSQLSTYVIKNLRAVQTTPAQKKVHPLRVMTLHGKVFNGIVADDGTVSAGAATTLPQIILTAPIVKPDGTLSDGTEWNVKPDGSRTRVGWDMSAEGFAFDPVAGILTTAGGKRGRPDLAGLSTDDVLALLAAARQPAPGAAGSTETAPETAPEAAPAPEATKPTPKP